MSALCMYAKGFLGFDREAPHLLMIAPHFLTYGTVGDELLRIQTRATIQAAQENVGLAAVTQDYPTLSNKSVAISCICMM